MIYRFVTFPVKISAGFFVGTNKWFWTFYRKAKELQQPVLEEKDKVGSMCSTDKKTWCYSKQDSLIIPKKNWSSWFFGEELHWDLIHIPYSLLIESIQVFFFKNIQSYITIITIGFICFLALLTYNWQLTLCKFKMYNVMVWYTYQFQNDDHNRVNLTSFHFFWWLKHLGLLSANVKHITQCCIYSHHVSQ